MKVRRNSSGYKQFRENGEWKYTHIRAAEKKVGGRIYPGREVHHIDGNKNNNRSSNLRVLKKSDHRQIHSKKR